jgi:hypothetical protein
MHGICALCQDETNLKESHLIPKFVGKWLKRTSATGYLRDIDNINKGNKIFLKNISFVITVKFYFQDGRSYLPNKYFCLV